MSKSAKSMPSQEEPRPTSRSGRTKPAAETALGEAKTAFVRAGFADMTFLLRWPEIAGAQIARIARPAKWQDGPEGATLTLRCEAGAIVFLQHQTRELTERLNAYLGRGRISRLKLVPGRLEQRPEPPAHPAPMASVATGKTELSHALGRLGEARSRLKTPRHARPAKPPD